MKQKQFCGFGLYPKRTSHYRFMDLLSSPEQFYADATSTGGKIVLRGSGRSYGDASLGGSKDTVCINTPRDVILNLNTESHMLTAMTGITFESILEATLPRGYILPVLPGTRHVTLGGAISSNIHGKNHHRDGGIYTFIDSMEICTQTYKGLCSRSSESELFQTAVGGFGLAGWIQSAVIKLKPVSSLSISATYYKATDLEQLMDLSVTHSDQYAYAVAWIDTLSGGSKLGRGVLMLGNHADRDEAIHPLPLPGKRIWKKNKKLPCKKMLSHIMRPIAIRAFNDMYYHQYPKGCSRDTVHIEDWFFPLDSVADWNHLYGEKGFLQYQFCIPENKAYQVIRDILMKCQQFQMGSFLSVLKKMKQDENALPFAIKGWTLAMDIPIGHAETFTVLNDLDDIVRHAGGRIYLAKDARMSENAFKAMYPEWESFVRGIQKYNPDRYFDSELARRLHL